MTNIESNDRITMVTFQEAVTQNKSTNEKPPVYFKLFPDLNQLKQLENDDDEIMQKITILNTILCKSCEN